MSKQSEVFSLTKDDGTVKTKEDFIKELSRMTKEEMNELIKKNGKPPKPFMIFQFKKIS